MAGAGRNFGACHCLSWKKYSAVIFALFFIISALASEAAFISCQLYPLEKLTTVAELRDVELDINTGYREYVMRYVLLHYEYILIDLSAGHGSYLETLYQMLGVHPDVGNLQRCNTKLKMFALDNPGAPGFVTAILDYRLSEKKGL